MKYPEPFLRKNSPVYYFEYQVSPGIRRQKSTGARTKKLAREVIQAFIDRQNNRESSLSLRQYADPFFTSQCPHVARLKDTGKSIGETHIQASRAWLKSFVFTDPIAQKPLSSIRRGDVLDFRKRIIERGKKEDPGYGPNTVNKVVQTLKTVLSEAYYRQDISMNPGAGIGHLDYQKKIKTVLSVKQIQELINTPYMNLFKTFLLFLIYTGCRVGEVRAIRWENISSSGGLAIVEAVKGKEIGPPKWNRTRHIVAPEPLHVALKTLPRVSEYVFPSIKAGGPIGETWVRKNHNKLLSETEVPATTTPHSYRHTLNSHLLASGMSPVLVQAWLGWSNNSLTAVQREYTHPELLDMTKVAKQIEELYKGKEVSSNFFSI